MKTNKKSMAPRIVYCLGLAIIMAFFIVKEIKANQEREFAVEGIVFNRETIAYLPESIKANPVSTLAYHLYATLEDHSFDQHQMVLRTEQGTLYATTYTNFEGLVKGKSYLFEGYIEWMDGQNHFVVDTIQELC